MSDALQFLKSLPDDFVKKMNPPLHMLFTLQEVGLVVFGKHSLCRTY